jgi:hypothetical protein
MSRLFGSLIGQARALLADLHHERAVHRVLQNLRVTPAASAQPYVVLVVDVNAVLLVHPRIVRSRSPVAEHVALLVEFQDERRGRAAHLAERWLHFQPFDRVRVVPPMNHPDVILGVDPDTDRGAENPMVR